jgi:hypothetical protein
LIDWLIDGADMPDQSLVGCDGRLGPLYATAAAGGKQCIHIFPSPAVCRDVYVSTNRQLYYETNPPSPPKRITSHPFIDLPDDASGSLQKIHLNPNIYSAYLFPSIMNPSRQARAVPFAFSLANYQTIIKLAAPFPTTKQHHPQTAGLNI